MFRIVTGRRPATLTGVAEWVARAFVPIAARFLPGGFFLSSSGPAPPSPTGSSC